MALAVSLAFGWGCYLLTQEILLCGLCLLVLGLTIAPMFRPVYFTVTNAEIIVRQGRRRRSRLWTEIGSYRQKPGQILLFLQKQSAGSGSAPALVISFTADQDQIRQEFERLIATQLN